MMIPTKIAYIYYSYIGFGPGVEKALLGKAQATARIRPGSVDFYALAPAHPRRVAGVNYVELSRRSAPLFYRHYFFNRYRALAEHIDLSGYDYIILRYPMADRSGVGLAQRYPIITEHHTNELAELWTKIWKAPSPVLKAGQAVQYFLERQYGPPMLRQGRGVIGVTNEIKQIQVERAGGQLSAAVIPNGIEVAAVRQTGFRPFDGRNLDIVMVVGSSMPWHGFDRALAGLNRYKGPVQITLHLIGGFDRNTLQKTGYNLQHVRLHGFQSGQALDDLMSQMHLALSTLALHRKGMREACSLKTREYTARGIPFVLAYDDPDLSAVPADRRFYLSLPNDDTAVDMEEIIAFADRTSQSQAAISAYMRQYAIDYMDWQIKMKQYLDFVSAVRKSNQM